MTILVTALSPWSDRDLDPLVEIGGGKSPLFSCSYVLLVGLIRKSSYSAFLLPPLLLLCLVFVPYSSLCPSCTIPFLFLFLIPLLFSLFPRTYAFV